METDGDVKNDTRWRGTTNQTREWGHDKREEESIRLKGALAKKEIRVAECERNQKEKEKKRKERLHSVPVTCIERIRD